MEMLVYCCFVWIGQGRNASSGSSGLSVLYVPGSCMWRFGAVIRVRRGLSNTRTKKETMLSSGVNFCKRSTCPSSETLLLYGADKISQDQRSWVEGHIDGCDFCGAELQLIKEHFPGEEPYVLSEIPLSLRHLAESLLGSDSPGLDSMFDPSVEKQDLTLTDA